MHRFQCIHNHPNQTFGHLFSSAHLDLLAAVEVDIVLPAVPRLVLVWEPWVERNRLHLFVVGHLFLSENIFLSLNIP